MPGDPGSHSERGRQRRFLPEFFLRFKIGCAAQAEGAILDFSAFRSRQNATQRGAARCAENPLGPLRATRGAGRLSGRPCWGRTRAGDDARCGPPLRIPRAIRSEPTAPPDVEARLEEIAKGVETIQATAIVKIGERLAEARDLFRYDRREGGFEGWCQARLRLDRVAAWRMISVYEQLGESVANSQHFEVLSKEALFQLAAPSTPEEVRVKVQQLLIDGEKVTAADVRRLRDEATKAKDDASATRAERDAILQRAQAVTRLAEPMPYLPRETRP